MLRPLVRWAPAWGGCRPLWPEPLAERSGAGGDRRIVRLICRFKGRRACCAAVVGVTCVLFLPTGSRRRYPRWTMRCAARMARGTGRPRYLPFLGRGGGGRQRGEAPTSADSRSSWDVEAGCAAAAASGPARCSGESRRSSRRPGHGMCTAKKCRALDAIPAACWARKPQARDRVASLSPSRWIAGRKALRPPSAGRCGHGVGWWCADGARRGFGHRRPG